VDDEKNLLEFLELNGYEKSPEGIKELLLDTIYDEATDKKRNRILEALREHPEEVAGAIQGIGSLAHKLINKKIFKA
jgi:hypothetical protein